MFLNSRLNCTTSGVGHVNGIAFVLYRLPYMPRLRLTDLYTKTRLLQIISAFSECPLLQSTLKTLTLKDAGEGGGPKVPTGQEIVCHFSQGHAMVTKSLDFIHKHPN